jgi:hypothetical protein
MNSLLLQTAKLPTWVNWLAQDADGSWWGFEAIPNEQHNGWYENEVGRYVRLCQEPPNDNWQNSLHKIKQD